MANRKLKNKCIWAISRFPERFANMLDPDSKSIPKKALVWFRFDLSVYRAAFVSVPLEHHSYRDLFLNPRNLDLLDLLVQSKKSFGGLTI